MAIVEEKSDAKEIKIPAILMAVGLVLYLVHALWFAGPRGVAGEFAYIALSLVIQVVLGLVACLCVAKFMGCNYGALVPGCFKLAAIFIFPGAIGLFIPIPVVNWLVPLILYWGLIEWLFELESMETVVTVIAIWLVQVAAFFVAAVILVVR